MSAGVVLAALAGVFAAAAIVELAETGRRVRESGDAAVGRRGWWPLVAEGALALGRRLGAPAPSRDLAARLEAAGAPLGLRPQDVVAMQLGMAVAAGLLAVPVSGVVPGRLGVVALVGAPVAGFLLPDLALRRAARRRGEAMRDDLADVADLLRVAVAAGLPTTRALAEVGRRHPGLLAQELGRTADRVALGEPRAEALAALRRRVPIGGVAALTAAVERADRHGAPLAPALEALAEDARADHTRRTRERAAKAAPQIQLVVALLLVPAVLLLVAAGLLAALAR